MRFKVISGVFEGHEFEGNHHVFDGKVRIVDLDSEGRSYPAEICMPACKHRFVQTTRNYKRVRKCTECELIINR